MKIYVGNLAYETQEADVRALFEKKGEVLSVDIIKDRDTGRAKGFGFVEMPKQNEAEEAIKTLNDTELNGRRISVSVARPPKDRDFSKNRNFSKNSRRY